MQTEIRVPQEAWRDFQNLASLIRGFNIDGSGNEVVLTPLPDAAAEARGLERAAEAIALLREHGEYARAGDWCDRRDALLDRIDELAKPAPDRCPSCEMGVCKSQWKHDEEADDADAPAVSE